MSDFTAHAALDEVRYARVWEDHLLVEEGLAIGADDEVISIGSAGCNVLNALLREPRGVTAVDVSPAQIALVRLKLAAIRALPHQDFVALLGHAPGDRAAIYAGLRARLDDSTRAFYDARPDAIAGGVANAGRLERYFASFASKLPAMLPAGALDRMLDLDDVAAQRALFAEAFATSAFKAAFQAKFNRETMASEGRDPTQLAYVAGIDVVGYFWGRLEWVMSSLPARDNFYLASMFTGAYRSLDRVPPYLLAKNYERLRALLGRVTIFHGDLAAALASRPRGTFTKANVSDVFEYMSEDASAALFRAFAEHMKPGGRICYWNLLVPRQSPAALADRFTLLEDLSRSLWEKDRSFLYRAFHVEEVR
jgi:S-adenosylmethionine-diacylglycerol 3-amino-3-carboxypropyl transferase